METINIGKNFDELPLTFEEFISMEGREVPIYNNFFLEFYNYKKDKNLLKKIQDFNNNYPGFRVCDDWAAFFS